MTKILLHGVQSPNVVKVAIMLDELKLDYDLHHVSVFKGEQFKEDFLAKNPLGKVPVLEDPSLGVPLAESGAILFYLAERHRAFLPTDAPARYQVMQWLMVQMASVGPMLGQFTHFGLLPEGSEAYGLGRYREIAMRLYRLVDSRVAEREWIAGGDYSIADIATQPWMHYLERHGLNIADYPALQAWRDRIDARPAVQRAQQRIVDAFAETASEEMGKANAEDLDRFFGRNEAMPEMDYSVVRQMR